MSWFTNLFGRKTAPNNFYTIDGGNPAPYPNMYDDDLYDFENSSLAGMPPKNRTWPTLDAYIKYRREKHSFD